MDFFDSYVVKEEENKELIRKVARLEEQLKEKDFQFNQALHQIFSETLSIEEECGRGREYTVYACCDVIKDLCQNFLN